MATSYVFTAGKFCEVTSTGAPAVGYKLYTYSAGTLTPLATYTNQGGATPNANPVVLDANGRADVWTSASSYRFILKTAADVTVWDTDNYSSTAASFLGTITANQVSYSQTTSYSAGTIGSAFKALGRIVLDVDATGASDVTAAMLAVFDACIPLGLRVVIPTGTYLVSGPISNTATIAAGSLQIECAGDVTINVSAGSTAFTTLLACQTTAINSSTIKGGRLTINLSNKCANGIYLRHYGTDGGTVNWDSITVLNAKENAATTTENQALMIYGRYTSVT